MKVRFYQLSKRNKSTKLATGEYREVEAYLKDKTSITHPVLLVQTFIGAAYNYFYIPDFNRYYFVSDGASVENMWEIAGTEDYLASFKTEIGATSANILYAHNSTKNIPDQRIPVTAHLLTAHESESLGFTISNE